MVNSTSGVLSANANRELLASGVSTSPSTSGSTQQSGPSAFADTLATCMFFGASGTPQSGSPSGTSAQSGLSATPTPAIALPDLTGSTTPTAKLAQAPADTSVNTIDKSNMTPDDAYWAEQPAAVQALRTMPDDQRYAAAQDLANQGYTIDVPIMVYGWDPTATMVVRQSDGLTWVPSAMQPNIPVAPGDSFPGLPSYDPNNPPAGSIKVTTDFAIGTNGQNCWIPADQLTASESINS